MTMKQNPLVYIASPYAGDIQTNIAFAKAACRYAIEEGATPIAVHLLYPQLLDDSDPAEREMGLALGLSVLSVCDELWVCGKKISDGMRAEVVAAEKLGIAIRYITEIPQMTGHPQKQQEQHHH